MENHDIDHSHSVNQTVVLVIETISITVITSYFTCFFQFAFNCIFFFHCQFKLKTSEYIDRGSYFSLKMGNNRQWKRKAELLFVASLLQPALSVITDP